MPLSSRYASFGRSLQEESPRAEALGAGSAGKDLITDCAFKMSLQIPTTLLPEKVQQGNLNLASGGIQIFTYTRLNQN